MAVAACVAAAGRWRDSARAAAGPGALQRMVAFLSAHQQWAYGVLFLGAYFETVVPFSLFVPGEIFSLGGALLAGIGALDLWDVMAVLYGGGVLGDNTSY